MCLGNREKGLYCGVWCGVEIWESGLRLLSVAGGGGMYVPMKSKSKLIERKVQLPRRPSESVESSMEFGFFL